MPKVSFQKRRRLYIEYQNRVPKKKPTIDQDPPMRRKGVYFLYCFFSLDSTLSRNITKAATPITAPIRIIAKSMTSRAIVITQ
jgi:hypothetical protein